MVTKPHKVPNWGGFPSHGDGSLHYYLDIQGGVSRKTVEIRGQLNERKLPSEAKTLLQLYPQHPG